MGEINQVIDIVTVCYNHPEFVELQIELLDKNLQDNCYVHVVDTSNNENVSSQLKKICGEAIYYHKVPAELYSEYPSLNNGNALNYAWEQLQDRYQYIGMLDNDVFLMEPFSVIEDIDKTGLYGHRQVKDEQWYLWQGFAFFNKDKLPTQDLDFRPGEKYDTGGGNWQELYSKMQMTVCGHKYESIHVDKHITSHQHDAVEWFDEAWLHAICGSGWAGGDFSAKHKFLEAKFS